MTKYIVTILSFFKEFNFIQGIMKSEFKVLYSSFRHKTNNNLEHRCAKQSLERKGTIGALLFRRTKYE